MRTWISHGQYGNGTGYPGGYVDRNPNGGTFDANGRQVFST